MRRRCITRLRGAIPIPRRNLFICIFAPECPTFRRTFRPSCSSFLRRQPPACLRCGAMRCIPDAHNARQAKNERGTIARNKEVAAIQRVVSPTTKLPRGSPKRTGKVAFSIPRRQSSRKFFIRTYSPEVTGRHQGSVRARYQ